MATLHPYSSRRKYVRKVFVPAKQQQPVPAKPQPASRRPAAVAAYKKIAQMLSELRHGRGAFAALTPAQRVAALKKLVGEPMPIAERLRIEDSDAMQKSERPEASERRPNAAGAYQRAFDNRTTNVVADHRTQYIDSREFCGVA